VATGSAARKSTTIVLQRVGLLLDEEMGGAGNDRQLRVGDPAVQLQGVLERDHVVVAGHDQRSGGDTPEVRHRQGRFAEVHLNDLLDHHGIMLLAVR